MEDPPGDKCSYYHFGAGGTLRTGPSEVVEDLDLGWAALWELGAGVCTGVAVRFC